MIDDSEYIPNDICMAIEAGKAKIKKIEEVELNYQNTIRKIIENRNKKYRELIAEQIPVLLRPYAHVEEINWPFTSEPESIQPSQPVLIKINGLPEFMMEWSSAYKKWIAFLPKNPMESSEIDYYNEIEVNDVEILLAELHNTILEQEH